MNLWRIASLSGYMTDETHGILAETGDTRTTIILAFVQPQHLKSVLVAHMLR